MTLRDAGWFGAGLLVALVGFILYGWRADSTQRGSGSAIAASSTHPSAGAAAVHGGGSLDAMLAQLEGRLRAGGGKESDWELLAQTYDYLGRKVDAGNARDKHEVASAARRDSAGQQWPLVLQQSANVQTPQPAQQLLNTATRAMAARDYAVASSAYEQLAALGQMSAQNWADYADVVATQNGGQFDGAPQGYIAAALELDATNEKALWLKASALHQGRRYALAVSTWTQLLTLVPVGSPDSKTFSENLAEDQRLASVADPQSKAVVDGAALLSSGSPARVIGEVTLAESLKTRVPSGLTLFIVAKSINSPGAPVAVVRTITGQWPLRFMLDDTLAMLPERKLSTAGAVIVEVRVSRGGTATSQSGDFQSTPAIVDPRSGKSVHLVIDHIIS
jgi:cytochrome c-type biogenesis protein CcmH/NrfG